MNGTDTEPRLSRARGRGGGAPVFSNPETSKVVAVFISVLLALLFIGICICSFCGQGQQAPAPVGDQIQPIVLVRQMPPGVPGQELPPQLQQYQQYPQYSQQYQQYPQYSQPPPQYTPSSPPVGSNPATPSTPTPMQNN